MMEAIYSTIVKFFQEGGLFIYPIAIVLALGLVIVIERWVFLTRESIRNIKAFEGFLPLLRTTDLDKMQLYSRENTAPVIRVIGCGLDMMKVTKHRADIEHSMNEGMLEVMPRLETRTGYLSMLANIATLLGLLGTIIGLISAFTAVASADPAQKSALLSLSISVAMNTTAFGLITAIPLLICYSVLQNKTSRIVSSIEMAAVKFLNIMTYNRLIYAGAQTVVESKVSETASVQPNPATSEAAQAQPATEEENLPIDAAAAATAG
ncbi:MAG: MotA/TolQ/ExbB proton channel family protein [Kangiellaceae bacterium]|nr:MotA/TolQ/ExbB proton channel family protein [Kangiellaceae bacterium]